MRVLHQKQSVHIRIAVDQLRPDLVVQDAQSRGTSHGDEDSRPFKGSTLRDILDQEFMRNHRFDGLTHLFTDLKGFLKNFVDREDIAVEGLDRVERDG